jgi:hypothetical protein
MRCFSQEKEKRRKKDLILTNFSKGAFSNENTGVCIHLLYLLGAISCEFAVQKFVVSSSSAA